ACTMLLALAANQGTWLRRHQTPHRLRRDSFPESTTSPCSTALPAHAPNRDNWQAGPGTTCERCSNCRGDIDRVPPDMQSLAAGAAEQPGWCRWYREEQLRRQQVAAFVAVRFRRATD